MKSRTYRSIFKWGNPNIEETIDKTLIKILKKRINFTEKQSLSIPGDEKIELDTDQNIDLKIIEQLKSKIGIENVSTSSSEILLHSFGKSYVDILKIRGKEIANLADIVVYPRDENDIHEIIQLCKSNDIAIVPTGGLTSVTEGIAFPKGGISLDMKNHMNQIIDINEIDQTVTVQSGIMGPDLEGKLNERGYTCGHFPQSFEFSTVGGWVATRSAGQESTGYGKIEDIVLGLKLIAPIGEITISPYPAKSIGPDLLEIILGSEGTFGIITEVTMKIQKIAKHNEYGAFLLKTWNDGINAIRQVMQGRFGKPFLFRLSDPEETDIYLEMADFGGWKEWIIDKLGYKKNQRVLLMVSTSGTKHYAKLVMDQINKTVKSNNGRYVGSSHVLEWLDDRFHTPYLRDTLMDHGIIIDTLETSTSWSNIEKLWTKVRETVKKRKNTIAMTHISHMYSTGANLYFIYMSKAPEENKIKIYESYQQDIIESIITNGGSISHHHGIGRLFAPFLRNEIGSIGVSVLKSIKDTLDPSSIMNPTVLGI